MKEIVDYLKTREYFNGLVVEFSGVLIEIAILLILIPIVLWIIKRKAFRFDKYHSVFALFNIMHGYLDIIGVLFQFDKAKTSETLGMFFEYWTSNYDEIPIIGYEQSRTIGDLKMKIYCLEHYCFNNRSAKISSQAIDTAKLELAKYLESFDRISPGLVKNNNVKEEMSLMKQSIHGSQIIIDEVLQGKRDSSELIEHLHAITIMILTLYYKYAYFEATYSNKPKKYIDLGIKKDRESTLKNFLKIETKIQKKLEFRHEFSYLIHVIKISLIKRFSKK